MSVPVSSAAHNGIIGDASATAASAQINQFLVTHPTAYVYQGASILTPDGAGGSLWDQQLSTLDIDQPFTMSGTTIGRVVVPLLPVGDGADLLVSLCADNSGTPGTVVNQTRIPATWIYQLSSVSGVSNPSTSAPNLQYTGNPLATAQFNTLAIGPAAAVPWPTPAASGAANLITPAVAMSGNYIVLAGGISAATSASQVAVNVVPLAGATSLGAALPQPSLPVAQVNGGLAITTDTVAYIGGGTGGTYTNAVYTASWNPTTGTIGAWSSQSAFPYSVQPGGIATNGENIYVAGVGVAGTGVHGDNAVTWASVSNGQITAWNSAPPLPIAVSQPNVAVAGGFLLVIGGVNGSLGALSTVYYAPINSNGSVGNWVAGPALPSVSFNGDAALQIAVTAEGVLVSLPSTNEVAALAVDSNGPGAWTVQNSPNPVNNTAWAAFGAGAGAWQLLTMLPTVTADVYYTMQLAQIPLISVPLPTSGLSNGATYHVMLQQQGGDLNNYLRTHTDFDAFPGDPTAKTSVRGAYTWTGLSPSGTCVPLQVFDDSTPSTPQLPLHIWEDDGARVSTFVSATTPDRRLLGYCEATAQSGALNANQGFETGIAPWQAFGGAVVQSSMQVFEGSFAAQVTPNGTSTQAFLDSENLACMPGQSIGVSGWMWFTAAVTSQASMSVNWLSLTGSYLSTSSNSVSVPAATWTQLSNTFTAPAGAYGFTINPILGGTPASSQVFYVDQVRAWPTYVGEQLSTVAQVQYTGSPWPGISEPADVVVLA